MTFVSYSTKLKSLRWVARLGDVLTLAKNANLEGKSGLGVAFDHVDTLYLLSFLAVQYCLIMMDIYSNLNFCLYSKY